MSDLMKKLIAEFIGTFVLVFCACGVAALTNGSLVATALAFGLVIVAMAYSIGRISGCHINPAVSFGCFLTNRMSFKDFLLYCVAQVLGGLFGAILIFAIVAMSDLSMPGDACNAIIGFNGSEVTFGGVIATILTEVILTCIFVYVILNVTDPNNSGAGKKAGLIIGLTLTLVHLVGIYLTGTSVNPARSIATAVATLIFNGEIYALAQVIVFIVAPLGGAALAALIFKALHSEEKPMEVNE